MSAPADDLPWPELGNVSRGATRGNQGQKGVLGPPDQEGRCVLQLRVQPGVLCVRLNRKASDWYHQLDAEVNRALKLTKTYWRKARRRQDYDARADQDHMELHEWLQQLKDKTMSHLEVLMQKGDIQGPPYLMADDLELTFLRKFIERQAAGIPHNPRLRNQTNGNPFTSMMHPDSMDTPSPGSDSGFNNTRLLPDHISDGSSSGPAPISRTSISPSLRSGDSLAQEAATSKQMLQASRASLSRAQKDTQDAFLRYTACLDAERQARQAVVSAEKRRDDVMALLLSRNPGSTEAGSRHPSEDRDDQQLPPRYSPEGMPQMRPTSGMNWAEVDPRAMYGTDPNVTPFDEFHEDSEKISRKRTWDHGLQVHDPYACDELGMPPRKRVQPPIMTFEPTYNPVLPSPPLMQ